MIKEKGNALMGIIVIIIVLLVAGVFFLNSYKAQLLKNDALKKQALSAQPANVENALIDSTTTDITTYSTSTELLDPIATNTAIKTGTSTYKKMKVDN